MSIAVGEELPRWTHTLTRQNLVRYAGASGDYNPIHYDDEFARSVGLPGIIVHGMLNMGLLARYVTERMPTARIERYGVRFRAMVRPGDPITFTGRVTAVEPLEGAQRVTLKVAVVDAEEREAVAGEMVLSVPA